jgi:hypothetical protein
MASTAATTASQNMAANPLGVTIIATEDPNEPHGVHYEPEVQVTGKGRRIKCPRNTGAYDITFTLQDNTNLGLHFSQTSTFLCSKNVDVDGCPTSLHPDFTVKSVSSHQLVVHNKNDTRGVFHYKLNILDRENVARPCDPIIENGGKIKPFQTFLLVGVGLAAVALVGHFVGLWRLW